MKKKYIVPKTAIARMDIQQILAGSIDKGGDYEGGEILSNENDGGSFWDDED